jgi:hypothetical protein
MVKVLKFLFNLRDEKKRLLITLFFSFLASLTIVRTYAVLVGGSIFIRGYQIHHFYFGMLCMSVGGLTALLLKSAKGQYFASILMGVGLGLFVDELGLLLNCTTIHHACGYSFPDVLDIFGVVTLMIVGLIIFVDLEELYQARKKDRKK